MLRSSEIFTGKDNVILSEAIKQGFLYGVLVDSDDAGVFTAPEGLNEISFIAEINDEGEFNERLLDAAISWNLNGRRVILEVPAVRKDGKPLSDEDINYALMVANNINANLAIIPSRDQSIDDFTDVVCKAASGWLENKMRIQLMPVWNYLVYKFANFYSGGMVDAINPDDVFVKTRYVDVISEQDANKMKARLDEVFESSFKENGGFDKVAVECMAAIRKRVLENMKDIVRQSEADGGDRDKESA